VGSYGLQARRPRPQRKGSKGDDMADKKVGRSGRERPITPTQKMEAALSDPGTLNVADAMRDKGKPALVDKFREREERWRKEQALHDQQAALSGEHRPEAPETREESPGSEERSEEQIEEEEPGSSARGSAGGAS
jgi:hypothetical protein